MDKRKMTIKIYTKLHRKLKFEQNAFPKGGNSGARRNMQFLFQ